MGTTGALGSIRLRWVIVIAVAALMAVPAGVLLTASSPGTPPPGAAAHLEVGSADPLAPQPGAGRAVATDQVGPVLERNPEIPSQSAAGPWLERLSGQGGSTPLLSDLSADARIPNAVERTLSDLRSGRLSVSDAYLPNLNLLQHPSLDPAESIAPSFSVSPAPMGIADFGLSTRSVYTIVTPDVLGELNLTSYNATGGSAYETTSNYYWNGLGPNSVATPWQSGVQLNTVVTNVSYPGSDTGVFWTQNVLDFSGNRVQFIDNVWNFSAANANLANGTLFSFNGTLVPDAYYYDLGPTFPVTYPLSIDLYNNASISSGRTTVKFGYRISEASNVFTGVYDTVVFHSLPTPSEPLLTPGFKVDGSAPTPFGLLYDAELIFAGPGGGTNAVVTSLNGSVALRYATGTGWVAPTSAYDYGTDTGETSIGVAGTWTGTTEWESQGPSLLYGLWNGSRAVPAGRTFFSAELAPSYGFVFIGPEGSAVENLSYAPSLPNGTVETWLPADVPPAFVYALTALADGFHQLNTTFTLTPAPTSPLHLVMTAAPGSWNAPIYLDGDAQASSFALDATGSSTPPLQLDDLRVDVNLTFNHLNDFGFPEFELLLADGVGTPFAVDNVTQGPDNPHGFTWYVLDYRAPLFNAPGLGAEFFDWSGSSDSFTDLKLVGFFTPTAISVGGVVSLWNTSNVSARDLQALNGSGGVWAADSVNVSVTDSTAEAEASVVYLSDSTDASASDLESSSYGVDVVDVGGSGGTFSTLSTSSGGLGFLGFAANRTTVRGVTSQGGEYAVEGESSSNVSVEDAAASNGSFGVSFLNSTDVRVDHVSVAGAPLGASGVVVMHGLDATVNGTQATGEGATAVVSLDSDGTRVANTTVTERALGVVIDGGNGTNVSGVTATDAALSFPWTGAGGVPVAAVDAYGTTATTIVGLNATLYPIAVWDDGSTGLKVVGLNASFGDWGVMLNGTKGGSLTALSCDADVLGVQLDDGTTGVTINASTFVEESSYGVDVVAGSSNAVYGNVFARDNGATAFYNPDRIQAASAADNAFNSSGGVGNRWGDWHTYAGPHLAPYVLGNGVADLDPTGPIAAQVTFDESGLPGTAPWRVSVGGAVVTAPAGNRSVTVWAPLGTDSYLVSGPHGYVVTSPAPTGTLAVSGPLGEPVTFAPGATRTATFKESGAVSGTDWCAIVVYPRCASTGTITFSNLTPGSYPYLVPGVPGYGLRVTLGGAPVAANGTLDLTTRNAAVHAQLTPLLYGVTFVKGGLASSIRLVVHVSVSCDTPKGDPYGCAGTKASGTLTAPGTSNVTLRLRNGTYAWKVRPIPGWELLVGGVVGWSGVLTVNGVPEQLELVLAPAP